MRLIRQSSDAWRLTNNEPYNRLYNAYKIQTNHKTGSCLAVESQIIVLNLYARKFIILEKKHNYNQ